jgi:Ca-activated chloride channel family protein
MLLVATSAEAGMDWNSLWRTPDQRAEQLLRRGDAAAAAQTYSDPRRKAYAELKAGDYSAAARDFAPFDDGDAHYDRGNALARNGDLQGAIKAYDAALARDPDNADARHNRELVERALKQQQTQQQDASNKNGSKGGADSKSDGGGSNKDGTEKNNPQNTADQSNKDASAQKSNDGAQNAQGSKSGNDKNAGKSSSGGGQQPPNEDHSTQNAATAQAKDGGSREPASTSQSQKAAAAAAPADSAEEARRDAKAGVDKMPAQAAPMAPGANEGKPLGATEADTAPHSEQQLAQEQWLRRIPDDPGGLLRRKFLIEHMLRQQQAQP